MATRKVAARPQPNCEIVRMTQDLAKELLGRNHKNRKLSEAQVQRLGGAVSRGEWMISTDAIGIDSDGGVVNGQHRLQMVVETGVELDMLVLYNVDPNIIRVIDQGMGRSFSQLLQMDGRYVNAPIIAGAIEWLYKTINGFEKTQPTAFKATTPQLLDLFHQHEEIQSSVTASHEAAKVGISRAVAAGIHYQCASVDPDATAEFFERLATGLDVEDGDPVYALREKIIANQQKKDKEPAYTVGAWLILAWEATQRGETMLLRNLKWRPAGGSKTMPYPKVSDVPWMAEAAEDAVADEEDAA